MAHYVCVERASHHCYAVPGCCTKSYQILYLGRYIKIKKVHFWRARKVNRCSPRPRVMVCIGVPSAFCGSIHRLKIVRVIGVMRHEIEMINHNHHLGIEPLTEVNKDS